MFRHRRHLNYSIAYGLISPLVTIILLAGTARAQALESDPCAAASSTTDVRLALALKDDRTVFKAGETIPMVMAFTASAKNRYWADVRDYDRSGRLAVESYCLEPEAPDPLESYFKFGVPIPRSRSLRRHSGSDGTSTSAI